MKRYMPFILSLLLCFQIKAQIPFQISGTIDSVYDGEMYLSEAGARLTDTFMTTIKVQKGKFSQKVMLPYYAIYTLRLDTLYRKTISFLIDSTAIHFDIDHKDMTKTKYLGSQAMLSYTIIRNGLAAQVKIAGRYIRAKLKQPIDTVELKLVQTELDISIKEQQLAKMKFIHAYPNSLASAYELTTYSLDNELDTVNKWMATLGEVALASRYGLKLKEDISNTIAMSIGKPAPSLEAKDTSGVLHRLTDYRGKYVLLDFWSSSCAPCRIQTPHLQRVNTEFGDKVKIISVSIEYEREQWITAIQKEKLSWLNLSDLHGWDGTAELNFKIGSLPSIYLISPDGIIISKRLHESSIYNTIKKELDAHK